MDSNPSVNPRKRKRSRFAAACSAQDAQQSEGIREQSNGQKTAQVAGPREDCKPSGATSGVSGALDLSAIPVAPVSTLKINQQAARAKKIKHSLKSLEGDLLERDPARNAFYDPDIRMDARTKRPAKPHINFITEGSLSAKAEKARQAAERRVADLLFRESMAARSAKAGSLPPLPPLLESVLDVSRGGGGVPDIEWWDRPFLASKNQFSMRDQGLDCAGKPLQSGELREDRITNYVHHPISIPSFKPVRAPAVLPLMLTEKERKRLRRQRRLEKETERREMIAVGLLPTPPPKVKLSNLMRVLANEATADPTKVEADVRAQVAERLRKHEAQNEARKKTKEELKDKAELKAARDREDGMRINVYRILSVESAQHRFKIEINARHFGLTGTFIIHSDCNLVIVEGGCKALKKYKNLLLRRIDWNTDVSRLDDDNSVPSQKRTKCKLVWEGPIAESAFESFKTVSLPTEASVKAFLKRKGMEAHYDCAMTSSFSPSS